MMGGWVSQRIIFSGMGFASAIGYLQTGSVLVQSIIAVKWRYEAVDHDAVTALFDEKPLFRTCLEPSTLGNLSQMSGS